MKNLANFVRQYTKNEDGLVTIEWVGIAAVVVIAGILITTFVMNGADIAANDVNGAAQTVAAGAQAQADLVDLSGFGDGT